MLPIDVLALFPAGLPPFSGVPWVSPQMKHFQCPWLRHWIFGLLRMLVKTDVALRCKEPENSELPSTSPLRQILYCLKFSGLLPSHRRDFEIQLSKSPKYSRK